MLTFFCLVMAGGVLAPLFRGMRGATLMASAGGAIALMAYAYVTSTAETDAPRVARGFIRSHRDLAGVLLALVNIPQSER